MSLMRNGSVERLEHELATLQARYDLFESALRKIAGYSESAMDFARRGAVTTLAVDMSGIAVTALEGQFSIGNMTDDVLKRFVEELRKTAGPWPIVRDNELDARIAAIVGEALAKALKAPS